MMYVYICVIRALIFTTCTTYWCILPHFKSARCRSSQLFILKKTLIFHLEKTRWISTLRVNISHEWSSNVTRPTSNRKKIFGISWDLMYLSVYPSNCSYRNCSVKGMKFIALCWPLYSGCMERQWSSCIKERNSLFPYKVCCFRLHKFPLYFLQTILIYYCDVSILYGNHTK